MVRTCPGDDAPPDRARWPRGRRRPVRTTVWSSAVADDVPPGRSRPEEGTPPPQAPTPSAAGGFRASDGPAPPSSDVAAPGAEPRPGAAARTTAAFHRAKQRAEEA